MVRKFFALLEKQIHGLHQAAYLLASFAILSQVLGLIRDRLLAASFGAGPLLDVYYTAFRIPDLIFAGIASLVSVYVLIPFLSEREGNPGEQKRFLDETFTGFFLAIALVSGVIALFLPEINAIFFPALSTSLYGTDLTLLTRILLIQPMLLGLSNLLGSITQTRGKFLLFALSPLLYNFGIIVGIILFYPIFGLSGLGIGVLLGALMHVGIQVPFIVRESLFPRFVSRVDWRELRRLVSLSLPRTLALTSDKFVLFFLTILAGLMAPGSVTIFNLAFNLESVPLAVIGVSYSVAAFPTLARLFSKGEKSAYLDHLGNAARHIIFWSLPIMALFFVLATPIVEVIFGAGAFGEGEARLTGAVLSLLSLCVVGQSLSMLFVRGYYAAGKTKRAVFITLSGAAGALVLSGLFYILLDQISGFLALLEGFFGVRGLPGTSVLLIPFSFSIATLFTACALWVSFEKEFPGFSRTLSKTARESVVAALLLGVSASVIFQYVDGRYGAQGTFGIFLEGFVAGIIGISLALLSLILFHNREIHEVGKTLRNRLWRSPVVSESTTS